MKAKRKIVPLGLELLPYQKAGVKWLLPRKRSLLADVPGLGKTPQAVVVVSGWQSQRVVIISPAVGKTNWEMEWLKWSTLGYKVLVVENSKTTITKDVQVVIFSYDQSIRPKWKFFIIDFLKRGAKEGGSCLIADEVHFARKWSAKRTRALFIDLLPHATHFLALTGTPAVKGAVDLHPICSAMEPGKWGKFRDYCYTYTYPIPVPFGTGIEFRGVRKSKKKDLRKRMSSFMIRRFKKDVLKDLPPKRFNKVYLDADGPASRASRAFAEEIVNAIKEERDPKLKINREQSESLPTLRRLMGLEKLPHIFDWIDMFREGLPNEPLVVFAHHKDVVRSLESYFIKRKLPSAVVTGETTGKHRARAIKGFQDGTYQIFLANILAAGTMINLQRASICIFAELDWLPANISQAVDRLHRIGQKNIVDVYFLLSKQSVDTHVIDVLVERIDDLEQIIGRSTSP